MNNFLEELKSTKVINKNDIEKIQDFINIKYKDEDSQKKAYMLSSTIHTIIENKIKSFPKSMQKDFKNTIFKNTFLNNKDSIYLWDIFYSYIHYIDFKEENVHILLNWVNLNIKTKTNKEDLIDYLYETNLLKNIEIEYKCIPNSKYTHINIEDKNSSDFNTQTKEFKDKSTTKKLSTSFFYKINIFIKKIYDNSIYFPLIILGFSLICIYLLTVNPSIKTNSKNIAIYENKNISSKRINTLDKNPNVPEYIKYKSLQTQKIKRYLYTKNSMLAEEPYFSSIIKSAEEFDINPVLLFAIAGQEQGFVPKKQKYAKEIANNPFNVFHSWKEYNTNIEDSSRIAGRTVFNLLKDIPKGQDPFKWINSKYAEDGNWWKGVKSIFEELEESLK